MSVVFKKVSDFSRGILLELLTDAYSFDHRYENSYISDWQDFDNFFFDHLEIADQYGLITTVNDEAIGFVSWDPRNRPQYAEIGHNCIASPHKGKGYGKMQLQEAVNRISQLDVEKIILFTNEDLIPAQRMYESVGFIKDSERKTQKIPNFIGEPIDYVYYVK